MIKRTKHDKVFSDFIRHRDRWTCQRCRKVKNPMSPSSRKGLHCSHFYGRSTYATRFDSDNCVALCYGCHRYLGSHPAEHLEFITNHLGAERFRELTKRRNMKVKRRDFLNDHFYNELQLMLEDVQNPDYGPPYSMANLTGD